MAAAAAVDNDSPSGRGVSRGAVEVSCAAGGALRVRPAAESEWLTCGAGSRVSACGKYADLCSQRTARARGARTTTIATTTTVNAGQPKAVMAEWSDFLSATSSIYKECEKNPTSVVRDVNCSERFVNLAAKSVSGSSHEHKPNAGSHTEEGSTVVGSRPGDALEEPSGSPEAETNTQDARDKSTEQSQPQGSTPATENNKGASSSTADKSTPSDGNLNQQSPSTVDVTVTPDTQGTVTSTPVTTNTDAETPNTPATTPPTTENTVEAPTTTPSPAVVIDPKISNIASTVQKKANVDSTVSPVWMRTAAPLLIVAVLFFFTVY
ncbi:uncharacterized protein TM35_000084410 [Trypanosoma theileri]|uniref:Uncharacterized protein n=1 Tax=Trypanosoma theileri TaxID=67003 RepID=A0A1X0P1S0_9TRYP|nr:uncharacterized protein TM35_000084410 [Trypanosoma theileri]ORC90643.1 hypothetical protein TM35_000084410 [Trypanosoma theileri]